MLVSKSSDGSATCQRPGDKEFFIEASKYEETLKEWRGLGVYPVISSKNGVDFEAHLSKIRSLRLQQWLDYGSKAMIDSSVRLFSIPGNDDGSDIVEVLANHPWVCNLDEHTFAIDEYELFGLGFSNPTPWGTPRELSECELGDHLDGLAKQINDWSKAIGIIHVPPYDSQLDLAPELFINKASQLQKTGGGMIPVGSIAVRKFIETNQPLAVLSGHCHESRGLVRIGSTICGNAGSQYFVGVLSALLLTFRSGKMLSHQFFMA